MRSTHAAETSHERMAEVAKPSMAGSVGGKFKYLSAQEIKELRDQ